MDRDADPAVGERMKGGPAEAAWSAKAAPAPGTGEAFGRVAAVRRASESDLPLLSQTLARAFFDDPVSEWSCPLTALRPAVLAAFFAVRLRQLHAGQEIWMSADGASAALWAQPGSWRTSLAEDLQMLRTQLRARLLRRLPTVIHGLYQAQRQHPSTPPHWYLAVLGTDPARQGEGLASAVLRPALERCDQDGIGAYLESSKERNIAFYARHGFQVTGEINLTRGPTVWAMWREPR